jgi:hypothetical protein
MFGRGKAVVQVSEQATMSFHSRFMVKSCQAARAMPLKLLYEQLGQNFLGDTAFHSLQ